MTAQYEAGMAEVARLTQQAEEVRVAGLRGRIDHMVESDGERRAKVLRAEAEALALATIALPGAPAHVPPYRPGNPTLVTFQPALEAPQSSEGPLFWKLFGVFATEEERDTFLARFPKSAGVKATTLGAADRSYPAVRAQANLYADGVNKGINETGLKRYRTIVRIAPELPWKTSFLNSYPTRAAFEAALPEES